MANNINFDDPSVYKRTRKKKYTISACMPPEGTPVFNKLERANYVTDAQKQFVLTGTAGEHWVIDAAKLCKTYTLANGMPLNTEVLRRMLISQTVNATNVPVIQRFKVTTMEGPMNWAVRVTRNMIFQIPTAWGDVLTVNAPGIPHSYGDYLVCADIGGMPNLNDRWVVNGEIFPATYDMRAFSKPSRTPSRGMPRTFR